MRILLQTIVDKVLKKTKNITLLDYAMRIILVGNEI